MKLRLLFIRHRPTGSALFVSLVAPSLDVDALNASRQEALHLLQAYYELQEVPITADQLWLEGKEDTKKFIAQLRLRTKENQNPNK